MNSYNKLPLAEHPEAGELAELVVEDLQHLKDVLDAFLDGALPKGPRI